MTDRESAERPAGGAAILRGSLLGRLSGPIIVACATVLASAMVSDIWLDAEATVLVCGIIVLVWSIARATRLAVIATPAALIVVNPFRSVRVEWDDVASVRHVHTQWASTPRIHRRDARSVAVFALSGRFGDIRHAWFVESADLVGGDTTARAVVSELTGQR